MNPFCFLNGVLLNSHDISVNNKEQSDWTLLVFTLWLRCIEVKCPSDA